MKPKDYDIIRCLRQDARQTLASISKKTDVPVSTVYDRIRKHRRGPIKKFTSIVNFANLGYHIRIQLMVKVRPKESFRAVLEDECINNAFRLNGPYTYVLDCVFKEMNKVQEFVDHVKDISDDVQVSYVVQEIKQKK